ncbi:hypothetical protein RRG08_050835 [Elysia crispata]|uniref:Uncharacterized protein n=1 Tax=Elysia crispata TaxID=231223 RepID=A0AAE1AEY9_9GAST|nr:hypothetical protein RRG08_050835 [Elysia crispata]
MPLVESVTTGQGLYSSDKDHQPSFSLH